MSSSAAEATTPATASTVAGFPYVPWDEFLARHFDWQQGEHVSLIGPTGTGKSTLAAQLYPCRKYVMVLGTKPADRTLDKLTRGHRGFFGLGARAGTGDYRRIQRWSDVQYGDDRVLLWPSFRRAADVANQRVVFDEALAEVFAAGGWCVGADEAYYLCKKLGLASLLETLWTQGRSVGVSLLAATQRPAHVPLFIYDQATHLFFWRDNDETNLKRIAGIGGLNPREIRAGVAALPKFHVLYVNARTGAQLVTRANTEGR